MNASDKIKEFIGREEGCKLKAYKPLPTDRWTIGYGTTYYVNNDPVREGDTITKEQAIQCLSKHIDTIASALSSIGVPNNVSQQQFDAVVSLTYNIGLTAFKTSPTGKLFYSGLSISDKFRLWNKSSGNVIAGLTTRREKEREIYDNGNYT